MATILIVEDDTDTRLLYKMALMARRHTVLEAATSAAALAVMDDLDYAIDAVVLDMGMPDTPGTFTVERIRANPDRANVKIVVVTANENYSDRLGRFALDAFFVKPITIADLVTAIEGLL